MKIEVDGEIQTEKSEVPEFTDKTTDKGGHSSEMDYETTDIGGTESEGDKQGQGSGKDGQQGQGEPKIMDEFTFDDIEPGDTIRGQVKFSENFIGEGDFPVFSKDNKNKRIKMRPEIDGKDTFKNIRFNRLLEGCKLIKGQKDGEGNPQPPKAEDVPEKMMQEFNIKSFVSADMLGRIKAGIRNIWMVGPAGCGKSTMAEELAEILGYPFFEISCGLGTSAAEFIGYKYPEREKTELEYFYERPSVILLDEFTALDPSVAQVANAALANGRLRTTTKNELTGEFYAKRHPDCIIIGTSNTFGTGANPQYVANNQLDASTRDRFVGGIIEVDYSVDYESQYDQAVVNFVWALRTCAAANGLQRVASTRMIIEGQKLKRQGYLHWARMLVVDWTQKELKVVAQHLVNKKVPVKFQIEPA